MKPLQLDYEIFDRPFWKLIQPIQGTDQYTKVYDGIITPLHDTINYQAGATITMQLFKSFIK